MAKVLAAAVEAGVHAATGEAHKLLGGGAVGGAIGALVEAGDLTEPRFVLGAAIGVLAPSVVAFLRAFFGSLSDATAPNP